jgi:hypothetical protein
MSTSYGGYYGGDPRKFHPDEECCKPEEIAAWKAACAAWDRGETPDPRTGPCQPGKPCERPYGIGVTVHDDEEDSEEGEPAPDLDLDEQEDEELLGIYLSNAGKDSEDAMRILAERHHVDEAAEIEP